MREEGRVKRENSEENVDRKYQKIHYNERK